jgi:hypothetical protein
MWKRRLPKLVPEVFVLSQRNEALIVLNGTDTAETVLSPE